MNIRILFLPIIMFFSVQALSQDAVKYVGKIKSIYSHERDSQPYFGIELEGSMDNNPCGSSLKYFIKTPDKVSEHHLSMLLAAHMANKQVEIHNSGFSDTEKCFGVYPMFNMVKIL